MRFAVLLLVAGSASWILVGLIRRYAISRNVVAQPTARGSHQAPIPRGGGAGLVIAAIGCFIAAIGVDAMDWKLAFALAGVVPAAAVGWIDDHASLPVLPRVAAHVASGLLIAPLAVGEATSVSAAAAVVLWTVITVSAINVVNFMDGLDGLIALQAVIFGAHLAFLGGDGNHAGQLLGLSLAGAAAGFLIWNWAPAKIFLGDVGSGSLAVLGVIGGILAWRRSGFQFIAVFLPLFPIFLDALITVLRRLRRGESLTQAHRQHLYQRLANEMGLGHARVAAAYGLSAIIASALVLGVPRGAIVTASAWYALVAFVAWWFADRRVSRVMSAGSRTDSREQASREAE
jgi:Fuc2NAc and GlcNAc transferase